MGNLSAEEALEMFRDANKLFEEELRYFDPYLHHRNGTLGSLKAIIDELKWYRENKYRITWQEWKQ